VVVLQHLHVVSFMPPYIKIRAVPVHMLFCVDGREP
jgi:hypothetical protein